MDCKTACILLNIKLYDLTEENLKKKYYKACLKYHPDKTKGDSANFLKVTEAYEYLKREIDENQIYEYIKKIFRALLFYFNPVYELTPTLKHLMNHEVYFFKEYFLLVPLWHNYIIFNKIHVIITPIIPDNIYIDNDNNIHVNIDTNINTPIDFEIGGISFSIQPIQYINKNIIELKGKGIPRINLYDVYDFSILSDVIVHINLC